MILAVIVAWAADMSSQISGTVEDPVRHVSDADVSGIVVDASRRTAGRSIGLCEG